MKYTLLAYVPTAVDLKQSLRDGRSFVARTDSPNDVFWVGTHQLYDTVEECVAGNRQTILDGIKQITYDVKQKEKRIEAMTKLLIGA